MPPLVPRKRLRETPPPTDDASIAKKGTQTKPPSSVNEKRKATLYDDLDASATTQSGSFLQDLGDDDSSSSLTSLSDDEFEDVPLTKRPKIDNNEEDEDDDDEDIEFEDVAAPRASVVDVPVTSGDLELTLNRDTRMSLTNPYGDKKGPSKRERKVRNAAHCLHVMTLLWHNAVRNSWLCDQEVQAMMLSHLPPRLWDEVDRWRRNSGLEKPPPPRLNPRGSAKPKGKGKAPAAKLKNQDSRDWSSAAARLEEGVVDMSSGDPLFRLMQSLTSWWKQRFRVRNPGLRKWGYMPLERLDRLTKAHKAEAYDPERFGEKVMDKTDLLRSARRCQGSRDVGSQLFTALLRGLGLNARMVANLQCLGFGWSKFEEAETEKEKDIKFPEPKNEKSPQAKRIPTPRKPSHKPEKKSPAKDQRRSNRPKDQTNYVVIDDTDELEVEYKDTDDESVVELESTPKRPTKPPKKYDLDLEYPHYWTEVLSPVTNKYIPVDPIVKGITGTNRDLIEALEPRGSKADKARQIMAYIVGYSPDGTAKDVTVRYLKKQMFPGRTKGARMPLEKVPVYNRHGKVKRYEHFDWFKTAMSGYRRGTRDHPLTELDEAEEATDLKPAQPEKKEVKEGEETLQYYKQSKEFALARHLKREEALKPGAAPVKIFKNKVKGGKVEEEDVFLRSDVAVVKSAETWHKQGRAPLAGEQPLKRVPYRAATLNRKREIMEAEAATGEKVLQGLFSYEQTDWIIPPPIKDGVIPKNGYGNIDLFAEHMCPEGAIHLPYKGAVKVCKRLQIDYAEAVVGFEFGHRMAVPVIQGVVIAEENHERAMEQLEKDEAERVRKEDEKRRKAALGRWRKFLMGMRIVERIRQEYGDVNENVSVFGHHRGLALPETATRAPAAANEEDRGGGFLPEGYEEDDGRDDDTSAYQTSSFFPVVDEDDAGADDGLIMEDHRHAATKRVDQAPEQEVEAESSPEPVRAKKTRSKAAATKPKRQPAKTTRSSRRRRPIVEEDEEEEEESGAEDEEWENPDGDDVE